MTISVCAFISVQFCFVCVLYWEWSMILLFNGRVGAERPMTRLVIGGFGVDVSKRADG